MPTRFCGNDWRFQVHEKTSDQRQRKTASSEQRRKHIEDLLDEALKETFPASDPPSIARPERNNGKEQS